MRMKNADLKEKLELAVGEFKDRLEKSVRERVHDAISEISCEIDCKVNYFLSELLIDLGLKKKKKLTITEKQIKQVLDEYIRPAMLEQIMRPSPLMAQVTKECKLIDKSLLKGTKHENKS